MPLNIPMLSNAGSRLRIGVRAKNASVLELRVGLSKMQTIGGLEIPDFVDG